MPYFKYPSIENHYQHKSIKKWLEKFPELKNILYLVEEKLHGSNLQMILDLGQTMRVASRNRVLGMGEKFFDVWNVLRANARPLREIQKWGDANSLSLNVYAELFGPGIQKGVYYTDYKSFRIIGTMVDGNIQPPKFTADLLAKLGLSFLHVPVLKKVIGLEKALAYDIRRPSFFTPEKEDNIIEGVVIKPYCNIYQSTQGKVFMIKKKNEEFLEKSKARKEPRPENTEVTRLNTKFRLYINENRLNNIFSKYGEIVEPKQMGNYIKYMLEDAKEDFWKDTDVTEIDGMSKAERRQVFNVGATVANMLKKHL